MQNIFNRNPNATYTQGLNEFSSLNESERAHLAGSISPPLDKKVKAIYFKRLSEAAPANLSYAADMPPVRNQGKCGKFLLVC
jgi:hypothetical protein